MNREDLIFEQYRLYSEQKEKFIDRSFMTNKFYLVVVLVLVLLTFMSKGYAFGKFTAPTIFAVAGIISCALWWLNMDTYNCLIKIKFSKVLEEMEKQLPMQPYNMEYRAIRDFRKNKKIPETSFRDLGHDDSLGHLLSRFFLYDKYKADRADDGSKQDPIDHIR